MSYVYVEYNLISRLGPTAERFAYANDILNRAGRYNIEASRARDAIHDDLLKKCPDHVQALHQSVTQSKSGEAREVLTFATKLPNATGVMTLPVILTRIEAATQEMLLAALKLAPEQCHYALKEKSLTKDHADIAKKLRTAKPVDERDQIVQEWPRHMLPPAILPLAELEETLYDAVDNKSITTGDLQTIRNRLFSIREIDPHHVKLFYHDRFATFNADDNCDMAELNAITHKLKNILHYNYHIPGIDDPGTAPERAFQR